MQEVESTENGAPDRIWKTIFERAIFGYFVETNDKQYFLNDAYVERLCNVENKIIERFGRASLITVVFAIFSVALSQNAFSGFVYVGFEVSKLPYLRELCVLFLGPLIAANALIMLDIITVSRMRLVIFSHANTEVPNMRMIHWKENNAWIDAIIPKYVGYSSGLVHKIFTLFSLIWVLAIPVSLIFFYISAQVIVFFSINTVPTSFFQTAIVYLGLFVSFGSMIVIIMMLMIPLPFELRKIDPISVPDLGAPDGGSRLDVEIDPSSGGGTSQE